MKILNRIISPLLIAIISTIIFSAYLPNYVFSIDSAKFVLYVRYMLDHGWSLIASINKNHFDYNLSLAVSLSYLSVKLFGEYSIVILSLPSAIASGITLSIVYLIGRLKSKEVAILSCLFLISTGLFFYEARTLSIIPYISLCSILILFISITLVDISILWLICYILFAFISGLFAGILGIIMACLPAICYLLCHQYYKRFIQSVIISLILALGIFVVIKLVATATLEAKIAQQVIQQQLLTLTSNFSLVDLQKYLLFSLIVSPIALLAIIINIKQFSTNDWLKSLTLWFVIAVIISILTEYKMFITAVASMALLATILFEDYHKKEKFSIFISYIFVIIPFISLLITLSSYLGFPKQAHMRPTATGASLYFDSLILLSLCCILVSFLNLRRKVLFKESNHILIIALAVASLLIVNIGVISPSMIEFNQTVQFSYQLQSMLLKNNQPVLFYKINPYTQDTILFANLSNMKNLHFIYIKNKKNLLYALQKNPQSYVISAKSKQVISDIAEIDKKILKTNQQQGDKQYKLKLAGKIENKELNLQQNMEK